MYKKLGLIFSTVIIISCSSKKEPVIFSILGHLLGGDRVLRENKSPKGFAPWGNGRGVAGKALLFSVGCPLSPFPVSLRKQYCSPVGH